MAAAGPVLEPTAARVDARAAVARVDARAAVVTDQYVDPGYLLSTPIDAGRAVAPADAHSSELQAPTGSGIAADFDTPEPALPTSIVQERRMGPPA